jgi:hypothetical protein
MICSFQTISLSAIEASKPFTFLASASLCARTASQAGQIGRNAYVKTKQAYKDRNVIERCYCRLKASGHRNALRQTRSELLLSPVPRCRRLGRERSRASSSSVHGLIKRVFPFAMISRSSDIPIEKQAEQVGSASAREGL